MSRKLMLSAAVAVMLLIPAYAEGKEWGSVGHELCHDYPDQADEADFPCPKNLPVRAFTCRPASEAEAGGMGHARPRRVHPFVLRADPSNASLTVDDVVFPTTDVVLDTSKDWQMIEVTTAWNGDPQIRDSPFSLLKTTDDGVWQFWEHLELYICRQK